MISKLPKWVWAGGAILAFAAGMVNAVAFMSFAHQAATHITGIFTHFSIDAHNGDTAAVGRAGLAIFFFFAGAAICGMIIRDAHLRMGRRYSFALFVESGILLAATFFFAHKSIWGEYLACMASGLQNAMVSTYSGTIVRTTHMTGILTDFGSWVGQWISGVRVDYRRPLLWIGLMASFLMGGWLGGFCYQRIQSLTMLLPAAITFCAAIGYLLLQKFRTSSGRDPKRNSTSHQKEQNSR